MAEEGFFQMSDLQNLGITIDLVGAAISLSVSLAGLSIAVAIRSLNKAPKP